MKPAQISKQIVALNDTSGDQKYTNFVNYMELRRIAGDESVNVEQTLVMQPVIHTNDVDEEADQEAEDDRRAQEFVNPNGTVPRANQIQKTNKRHGNHPNKKHVKDKEKNKRMKGQSSQSSWKPEEFMRLKQTFD